MFNTCMLPALHSPRSASPFHINDFYLILDRGKTFPLLSLTIVYFKKYHKLGSKDGEMSLLSGSLISN